MSTPLTSNLDLKLQIWGFETSDQILSGLIALVNVKMTEMANQINVGGVYHSQMHSISSDANYLNVFFSNMAILRERGRERDVRIVSVCLSLQTIKLSIVT